VVAFSAGGDAGRLLEADAERGLAAVAEAVIFGLTSGWA
jgi:hypothetical protein